MDYVFGGFNFPISALADANIITVLILIPLLDRIIYPWLIQSNVNFTMLQKIGTGYFIVAFAMIVAGLIEIWRKESSLTNHTSTCDSSIYLSELSILWQIPQYVLVGVSEVFASITSLHFFASQAPPSMRGTIYALNLVTAGIGILLAALLVVIVDLGSTPWIPNNLDNGHLEYYYFLIAALMLITLLIFIPIAKRYKYWKGTETGTETQIDGYTNLSDNEENNEQRPLISTIS
jgi:dipeptide/tripeptide permease